MGNAATHETGQGNILESLAAGPLRIMDEGAEPAAPQEVAGGEETDFLQFYGLKSNPFADSVNPDYFFRTERHEEALVRTMLAVRHDLSFALITGPSGTGKTLVSQMILTQLDEARFRPVLVLVSPGMGKTALLREILSEMSVPAPEGPFVSAQDLLNVLGQAIMDTHGEGRKPVLIIDESHFLSAESLHMVRTISNIELPDRKLVTCLLFAEERFVKRLQHSSYDSLRNRMYLHTELRPLTVAECGEYVRYRLLVAGRMDELFAEDALELVHARSGGICRNVNKIGMLSLFDGFMRRAPVIEAANVERAMSAI